MPPILTSLNNDIFSIDYIRHSYEGSNIDFSFTPPDSEKSDSKNSSPSSGSLDIDISVSGNSIGSAEIEFDLDDNKLSEIKYRKTDAQKTVGATKSSIANKKITAKVKCMRKVLTDAATPRHESSTISSVARNKAINEQRQQWQGNKNKGLRPPFPRGC